MKIHYKAGVAISGCSPSSKRVVFGQLIGEGVHLLEAVALGALDMPVPGHVLHLALVMDFEPSQDDAGPYVKGTADTRMEALQLRDEGRLVVTDVP